MKKKFNFSNVGQNAQNAVANGLLRIAKGIQKATAFVATSAMIFMGLVGCEKSIDSANFDRSGSAGALATLTCADTASIPVDANGIITIPKLTSNKLWKLNGVSYVKDGQTLTIDPGTTIITGRTKTYNDPAFGNQTIAGVLVVAKGGKLIANGTATQPIVFTTPSAGGCGTGCSTAGKFGGVVILGKATTNTAAAVRIEGVPQPAGTDITYGGPANRLDNDNSGSLQYVRIEFPGYRLDDDNEINGLTLGGVGRGTKLSNIQVSYSADDAFEFFGGTVNADHLVALGTDDDDFDFDLGYTGTITYALGLKDPGTTNSTSGGNSDSNGIESDNNAGGTTPAPGTPYTKPVLRHFTLLGYNSTSTKLRNGNRWRRASEMDIQRSVIGGFSNSGSLFESAHTIASIAGFTNNVVHGFTATSIFLGASPAGNVSGANAAANGYLQLGPALGGNPFFTCAIASTYNPAHLIPRSGSPAFGTAATYKGAFQPGVTPWTATWTKFNPGFCCN